MPSIAGVQAYSLAEEHLYGRDEWVLAWQIQAREREVRGCEATLERTCVVALWDGDFGDGN